jgi:uncharacterized membrane protein YfcA
LQRSGFAVRTKREAVRWHRRDPIEAFGIAGLLAVGFFVGASIGALAATRIDSELLRKLFGLFFLVISLHMIFGRHR